MSTQTLNWSKTFGGINDDAAFAVVQTNDGGYAIAGSTETCGAGSFDFWLLKTDACGSEQWNKTYGGVLAEHAYSVVQTSDGGYALAGITYSFGAGTRDVWLVKTDASGIAQWNKTYGGAYFDEAHSVVQTGDGGYVLAGCTQSYSVRSYGLCLVKVGSFGNTQWNNTYGETEGDHEVSMVQTDDGGFALLGDTRFQSAGDFDFLLVKIDSFGSAQWNRTYGGSEKECAWVLMQTGDGGYTLAGYTYSFGAGSSDAWLVKTDGNGSVIPEFPVLLVLMLFQLALSALIVLTKKCVRSTNTVTHRKS